MILRYHTIKIKAVNLHINEKINEKFVATIRGWIFKCDKCEQEITRIRHEKIDNTLGFHIRIMLGFHFMIF